MWVWCLGFGNIPGLAGAQKVIERLIEERGKMEEDLDRWLAEKVMGWEYVDNLNSWYPTEKQLGRERRIDDGVSLQDWHPTTDITQAFQAVGKVLSIKNQDYQWEFDLNLFEEMSDATFCKHYKRGKGKDLVFDAQSSIDAPAMAICKATKEAMGGG